MSNSYGFQFLCGILLLFMKTSQNSATAATMQGNETDLHTLLDFKSRIVHDPYDIMSLWNDSTHHCNWVGITCNNSNGRVMYLILENKALAGTVPPSIGNLTFLTRLNLRNSSFHGEFPQEVGHLQFLRHLNIGYNSFGGSLPSNLSHCKELSILSAGHNNFTGTIPPWMGNSSSLSLVNLAVNNLHGSIPNSLNGNYLSGTIPPSIFNISSLHFFTVSQNHLHGNIPFDVGYTLPKLETFAGGVNYFTGPIPVSLSNASRLKILDFAENNLTGTIPKNLGRLPHLIRLNFDVNRLGTWKAGDLNFLASLVNCSALEVLGLAENSFGGELPSSIANLSTQLNILTLGSNAIHGSIPTGIGNLANLTVLGLEENSLSRSVPDSIGMLQKLERLDLNANNFFGLIPSSFGNLTRLTMLFMEENNFEGSIPTSLGKCQSLSLLNFSHNMLNGTIPRQVIALSSLSIYLDLSHNALIGSVPIEVGKLINLEELDLSENKLSGMIPSSLGSCISLEWLHLQGNFFEGNIPSTIQNLRGLQDIDMSSNNLFGEIPEFLGEFKVLEHLNLSYNDFEGKVPLNGIFKSVTSFSMYGNSKLCGGVPELYLPACTIKKSSSLGPKVVILVAIALVFLLLLSCFLTSIVVKRARKRSYRLASTKGLVLPMSYSELAECTCGFSQDNLIGSGSFGSVYKGTLSSDGSSFAVKVLNLQQKGASRSFFDECHVLRSIRHRNLLKIITAISSVDYQGNDFKALVFEFMPNGSLEDWLHPIDNTKTLTFIQRLNIAIDVGCALEYLHHFCETPIVHCDIKPSNVLLDNDMVAHVGDFGLATFLFEESSSFSKHSTMSTILRGSIGYIPPEYGMGGHPSAMGDIYSYGILLLEVFTRKRPTDEKFEGSIGIQQFAALALPNNAMNIIDPLLLSEQESEANIEGCLVPVLHLGVSCSTTSPSERKPMTVVVNKLHAIKNSLGNGTFAPKCSAYGTNRPPFCLSPNDKKGCNFPFLKLVPNKGIHTLHAVPSKTQVDLDSLINQAQTKDEPRTVHVKFQLIRICNYGEHFQVVGDDPMFGSWNPSKAVPMTWSEGHIWTVEQDIPVGKSIQFKFILKRKQGDIVWQPGPDRIIHTWESMHCVTVCEDWDNAQLQKITEESQNASSNEEPKTESEKANSVLPKEKHKSNAPKVLKNTC
ncbi:probable LRR receptor-like serine/threonine-protein kinase At3g47570 [Abrus precatorius]|uniref:non-specific serine/threonine protein kinase n=1 Tax=Abrus precatorius TaxID=3816 RepID=A0A8B8L9A2_ABRPR|nr:probable LRR receptor-like serine/threonine-protein kinase At3g47570 [Abrus precatorius]